MISEITDSWQNIPRVGGILLQNYYRKTNRPMGIDILIDNSGMYGGKTGPHSLLYDIHVIILRANTCKKY